MVGGKRPKDRRAQILAVAARRFHEVGYHNTGLAGIAAEVGITAGALYRHFRGKEDLLAACISEAAAQIEAALTQTGGFEVLVGVALDNRALGVLWQREGRYLAEDRRREFRRRLRAIASAVSDRLRETRPDLPAEDAALLAWSVLAVLAGPSHHSTQLERPRFEALLDRLVLVVASHEVPAPVTTSAAARPAGLDAAPSRRQALLTAAVGLFNDQGYPSASMIDVGSAAGISGPSVYNHFANKSELLVTALTMAHDALQEGLELALSQWDGPMATLGGVLDSYLELTLRESALVGTLVTEVIHLPEAERRVLRQVQHDYVAQWVALLRKGNPMPEPAARIVVHTVLTLVNDLSRIPHLRERPNLTAELASLGRALFAVS